MQPWHVMFFMMFLVWLLSDYFDVIRQQHVINHDDPISRRKVRAFARPTCLCQDPRAAGSALPLACADHACLLTPLLQDNFVDAEAFEELVGFVLKHPFVGNWTWAQKTAAVVSMMHPWGHCNVDGFQQLCLKSDVRFLCEPLLKRVKEHNSNAFVLKLYMGYASDYAAAPSFFYSTLPLQGTDGPGINDPKNRWAPKTVSIFDVQVPAGMQGGQLQVFEDTNDKERDAHNAHRAGPARMEAPAANSLHTLRGDTYYTFTDYDIEGIVAGAWQEMPAEFRRMSIVFEQYIISNSSYPGTYEYDLWQIDRERVESVYAFGTVLWMCVGT